MQQARVSNGGSLALFCEASTSTDASASVQDEQNGESGACNNDTLSMEASLNCRLFASLPVKMIKNLNGDGEINVNLLLGQMPYMRGKLKSIIQRAATLWLDEVMPMIDRVRYSTCRKPRRPQTRLPERFINSPVALICTIVRVDGCVSTCKLPVAITTTFERQLNRLFSHARYLAKRVNEFASASIQQ